MAQPSVAQYFNTRKRTAVEDAKINVARKVLKLDDFGGSTASSIGDSLKSKALSEKIAEKLTNKLTDNKIATKIDLPERKKIVRTRQKKVKEIVNQKNIDEFLKKSFTAVDTGSTAKEIPEKQLENEKTPPSTPTKTINAMDKVKEVPGAPTLKEIKRKMTRSARLAELRASISRFQEKDKKLKEIEQRTAEIPPPKVPESPKLKSFKTIQLEIETSPQKTFSPEKQYLSPKKDLSARRNLLNLLSPTRNAIALAPQSPSKQILEETSKPALTLPFKYRYLAEIFRSIDTVAQILFNRKETITFKKLKPAVEAMLKRNLTKKHLAQIKFIYPEAFTFKQEKLRVFGTGQKTEEWELILVPNIGDSLDTLTGDVVLERRRKLFNILLDKVKNYHDEFLQSLDPPLTVDKSKITRWHPEFDIERVPDIETADLPQAPVEDKMTSGQNVLEKAKEMFNCNTRMEAALQRLQEARESNSKIVEIAEKPKELPQSVLKGIPLALLEKVRQKQAAKALLSMTRSADKEKEVQSYSRLPELARLIRNVFVSEKKSVLALDVVLEKLGNSYRGNLSKVDMEAHLRLIAKETPGWLVFHKIRNMDYVKVAKDADLSIVLHKLESLVKEKSES